MEGSKFQSPFEFFEHCSNSEKIQKLNPSKTLGRVYNITKIKDIADSLSLAGSLKNIKGSGVPVTYKAARALSKAANTKLLGDQLSKKDHEFHFPLLSYFKFTDDPIFKSPNNLIQKLSSSGVKLIDDFHQMFNGLYNPSTRKLSLESVRFFKEDRILSLLYSCTRILMSPESDSKAHSNCFLARIPVVVRFIFDRQLIEISFPLFYEPLANIMKVEGKYPTRFQQIFEQINVKLVNLLGTPLGGVNFDKIPLHLEVNCGAEDMGWQIEPQVAASFDLKQNVVPLKQIFDSFIHNLELECKSLRKTNPLNNINLYSIFRALKEQGYTLQMIQSVPFKQRGARTKVSLINGERNSGMPPFLFVPESRADILKNLRMEVWNSQIVKVENPYSIVALLPN